MYRKPAPAFRNRYRITGTLTARTPIHAGDGESLALRDRSTALTVDDPDTKYNSFLTGDSGSAVIPGSTLKGLLRAWAMGRGAPEDLIRAVFGTQERGGKAEFHDAPLFERSTGVNDFRWWDLRRGTCLVPGVAIDPRTRTAIEHLLFYTEYAPEGSKFKVTITGRNLEPEERDLLLFALQGFTDADDPIRVGAHTAEGWGLFDWSGGNVEIIEPQEVAEWLKRGAPNSYETIYRAIPLPVVAGPARWVGARLLFDIRLKFDGALLVNDPSQFRRRSESEPGVGHATVRRRNGDYFLPGSGVRGALRAQLRRIWQTLAYTKDGDLKHASQVEAKTEGQQKTLHPVYRMMGAPGWRTPVSVPDFELVGEPRIHTQEFVAIDRFTGGAAEEKKFGAQGLYAPEFRGAVTVELNAWKNARVNGWALLLLLFLLRDLQEGDVQFGFGASKGYGACRADVAVRIAGQVPEQLGGHGLKDLLEGVLCRKPGGLANVSLDEWETELLKELNAAA